MLLSFLDGDHNFLQFGTTNCKNLVRSWCGRKLAVTVIICDDRKQFKRKLDGTIMLKIIALCKKTI